MPESRIVGPFAPRLEPTPEDVAKLEAWASDGFSLLEMARGLGISKDTLSRWRREHPAVVEALEAGRDAEHKLLRSKLMEKALAGDSVCLIFALKARHQWRENDVRIEGEASARLAAASSGSLTDQAKAVMAAAAAGEVTLGAASQLLGNVAALAKAVEIDELATRIAALEARGAGS